MTQLPIYLDHHATTPLDARVLDAMLPYLREDFGNAASNSHVYGWRAEGAVADARERIAGLFGASPEEFVFTSGATEANNLAILGTARARRGRGDHLITIAIEHPSVLDPMQALEREGVRASVLAVDEDGLVDPEAVSAAIGEQTVMVSIAAANGEIGVLQPLAEIADICAERGVLLHTDAAQAAGKIPLCFETADGAGRCGVDLASISAHKLYGPKGIGALYIRKRRPATRLEPLVYGGGHERGLRSGTLPVALIVGFAKALELCVEELEVEARRLSELRDRLWRRLSETPARAILNGSAEHRLAGNLNVSFPGVDGEKLLLALPDVAVSTGSACSSAKPEASHVLLALGLTEDLARSSLRVGLGRGTTAAEVDRAADRIAEELQRVGK
jgi:cysteine desulfurase